MELPSCAYFEHQKKGGWVLKPPGMINICILVHFPFMCVSKVLLPGASELYDIFFPVRQFHPAVRSELSVQVCEPRRSGAELRKIKVRESCCRRIGHSMLGFGGLDHAAGCISPVRVILHTRRGYGVWSAFRFCISGTCRWCGLKRPICGVMPS